MKKITLILMLGFFFASTGAIAAKAAAYDFVTTGGSSKNKTNFYAGLNWTLGGNTTPALVLGVFKTKVKSDGDTTGGNLAFHVNLAGSVKPGKLKLSYLNGKRSMQGELGLGFNFLKKEPLIFLGVNGPYVAAGVDGYLNPGFVPYAQSHTQGKFDKPGKNTYCAEVVGGPFNQPDCTNLDP